MRRRWARSCSVAWLLGVLGPREAGASHLRAKETVHRVDKVFVTTQLERRAASSCPENHSLCPASAGGGCCPDRYGCASDSCFATTAGTTSACGRQAYYACGAKDGGGCCPEGYLCGPNDCSAPPGVTTQPQCPVNYYLCPASFNYGCCQNGMGCALNVCYATTPLTYQLTQAFTTTVDGKTVTTTTTSTTISTPFKPTGIADPADTDKLAKFIPTTQSKVPEIPSSESPGLTQAQTGGIIGGAIGLLVVILIATCIIVRRLRKTAKEFRAASKRGSSSGERTSRPVVNPKIERYRPSPSQSNHRDYDGLLQYQAGDRQSGQTSEYATPFPSSTSEVRHTSMDTTGSYFPDVPTRVSNMPGRHSTSNDARTSVDSHNPAQLPQRQHGRHASNASEMSDGSNQGGVGSPLLPAELGTDGRVFSELPGTPVDLYGRRTSGGGLVSPLSIANPRPSPTQTRRRSDAHSRDRSNSSAAVQGGPPLDVVNESVEQMHGYFGPIHVAAGQTRAGVVVGYDISSPIAPRISQQPPPP